MKIQNLVEILGAKLINEPQISAVCGFCFEASLVKNGECYFANSASEARIAVQNGAYAIVGNVEIFDNEVAFIFTNDLNLATMRLIRYFFTTKKLKLVLASKVQMQLLRLISGDFELLQNDLKNILFSADKAKQGEILFLENSKMALNASFNAQILSQNKTAKNTSSSLFYSDFIFNGTKYSLALCYIFLNELCGILDFFNKENIEFKLKDFREFSLFKVLFVGYKNQPLSMSNRAFICVNDKEIFAFVKEKLGIKSYANFGVQADINFKNLSELKELKFNKFALVYCQAQELINILSELETQESLF